eukprot:SAG11_NODE_15671_length_570_cov_0.798301_1_plen_30_part_10
MWKTKKVLVRGKREVLEHDTRPVNVKGIKP